MGDRLEMAKMILGGVPISYRPELLSDSRTMFHLHADRQPYLIAHSQSALILGLAGVMWHDEPDHCPSWAGPRDVGACRCDVEVPRG